MNSPSHIHLFQYGSNMNPSRLNKECRLDGRAEIVGAARLDGWGVRFNLYSNKKTYGVTNIVQRSQEHVLGVLFKVSYRDVIAQRGQRSPMDKVENARKKDRKGSYKRQWIEVKFGNQRVKAVTYLGTYYGRQCFRRKSEQDRQVHNQYFRHLLIGAEQFQFPQKYVDYLNRQAGPLKG